MLARLSHFKHIWALDFEYVSDPGEVPEPVCMVAIDLVTGQRVRQWRTEMYADCPFDTGADSLFIFFAGTGDMGCFLKLGWPLSIALRGG